MNIRKEIRDLGKIDPLSEAEKISGVSYKEDDKTVWLGMTLQMYKSNKMEILLESMDDTQFTNTVSEYIRKVSSVGFEVVLCDTIKESKLNESFYILFNKELGVLISFDTHKWDNTSEEHVNGGKIYYNWLPKDKDMRHDYTSSGGFYESDKHNELVWVGDHDCRQAAITNILALQENGTLLNKWIKQPFLWFVAHDESNVPGYSYEKITRNRYFRLPQWVKDQIGPYDK